MLEDLLTNINTTESKNKKNFGKKKELLRRKKMEHFQEFDVQFKIGEDGRVCRRRDGESWADKVLDGVLDQTMYWKIVGISTLKKIGENIVGKEERRRDSRNYEDMGEREEVKENSSGRRKYHRRRTRNVDKTETEEPGISDFQRLPVNWEMSTCERSR